MTSKQKDCSKYAAANSGAQPCSRPDHTESLGWYTRGYLPHFDSPGQVQHITFHLADSLPRHALIEMKASLAKMDDTRQKQELLLRFHKLLDAGHGCCILRHPAVAQIVANAFLKGAPRRYDLFAWVIMPNHVHLLIKQKAGFPLARLVQHWKSSTAYTINTNFRCHPLIMLPEGRSIWQRDYWDRYIRNAEHFLKVKAYIENNPANAGLVRNPRAWRWGSLWMGS